MDVLAQGLPIMLFSTDEASNKAVIYAGVPPNAPSGFKVLDWLTPSIAPLKGRGGGGKNGIAQGQVSEQSIPRIFYGLGCKSSSNKCLNQFCDSFYCREVTLLSSRKQWHLRTALLQ